MAYRGPGHRGPGHRSHGARMHRHARTVCAYTRVRARTHARTQVTYRLFGFEAEAQRLYYFRRGPVTVHATESITD